MGLFRKRRKVHNGDVLLRGGGYGFGYKIDWHRDGDEMRDCYFRKGKRKIILHDREKLRLFFDGVEAFKKQCIEWGVLPIKDAE